MMQRCKKRNRISGTEIFLPKTKQGSEIFFPQKDQVPKKIGPKINSSDSSPF